MASAVQHNIKRVICALDAACQSPAVCLPQVDQTEHAVWLEVGQSADEGERVLF